MNNDKQTQLQLESEDPCLGRKGGVRRKSDRQTRKIDGLLDSTVVSDITLAELRAYAAGDLSRFGASLLIDLLETMRRWGEYRLELMARIAAHNQAVEMDAVDEVEEVVVG
jgi:hypothetical protein